VTATRKPQQRRVTTRENLLAASRDIVGKAGYAGLRAEDVVARAGVAKGTLFAHFADREHLIAALVAEDLSRILESATTVPRSLDGFRATLEPVLHLMGQDLQVLSAMIRFSTPEGQGTTGMYAVLCRQGAWITAQLSALQAQGAVRQDQPAGLLSQAVQAFMLQAAVAAACDPNQPRSRLGDLLSALLAAPE
jgi:TetR/AcrR family transcriptional regulator, fatty acid biosynthesis regulator